MKKNLKNDILEYINIKNSASTKELTEVFNISESTCRRQLKLLEKANQIRRFHGGALALDKAFNPIKVNDRYELNAEAKEIIAYEASQLIKPETTIILLGGTTVYRMCKYIKNMKLTVITNSMIVFHQLCSRPGIKLILLGGEFNEEEAELTGVLTVSNSGVYVCDNLFMGVSGYISGQGFTTSDPSSVELYSLCISMSDKVAVLMDSTKFSMRSKAITITLNEVDTLISESFPEDAMSDLENHGIKLIHSKKKENDYV